MALFSRNKEPIEVPVGLGRMLEVNAAAYRKREALRFDGKTVSYQELNEQANRVAGGLESLGIAKGDRVAMMLPNIPEFVYSFFGIQKLGAVAVPFNTMYKGREITHILQDSGARAVICLSNYANLINEVRCDCPDLEHVIVTGQRTFVYLDPDATVNVQMVAEKSNFDSPDAAFHTVGEALAAVFHDFGLKDAWYKHQGAIRCSGRKLAIILIAEIENLYVVNIVTYLQQMDTGPLFKVLYVPPEIRDKALEPSTSIAKETGVTVSLDDFKDKLVGILGERLGVEFSEGELTRDELMAYEKNRALANRI